MNNDRRTITYAAIDAMVARAREEMRRSDAADAARAAATAKAAQR